MILLLTIMYTVFCLTVYSNIFLLIFLCEYNTYSSPEVDAYIQYLCKINEVSENT